jgi:endonuclease/exonuclease/phosphatase family metal-dependent hydrolase
VSFTASLAAGRQLLTVYFDNGNVNLNNIRVVTGGSSVAAPAPPPPPPPPPPSASGTELSVLTWNIRIDDYSESHARRAMALALTAWPRPQVIAIQEAYRSKFDFYLDELRRQTGVTWYGAFANVCPPGGWNGSSCTIYDESGIGIFSSFPIVSTDSMMFPGADCWTSARPGLRAAINVNGRVVQIFNAHLQTGSCSNVMQQRYTSISRLKQWAQNYSTPQLVAGDFQADPDQIASSSGMSPNFVESFAVAGSGNRFTFSLPNPTMKIDYWFFDQSWAAQPLSSETVWSTGSESDHLPLRATFLIR